MTEVVTSLQNTLVKQAAALQQKKRRDDSGLFLVEGIRLAEELLAANWDIEFGFYTQQAAEHERAAKLITSAGSRCKMIPVTESVFAKISETEQPQGVLLVSRQMAVPLQQLLKKPQPLLVVIDGVQDPGNLGTLLRTADAAGADGVIITEGSTDPYSGKALRASMGSLFHLPLSVRVVRSELLSTLQQAGVKLVATAIEHGSLYLQADFQGAVAIVFGNEGQGVSQDLLINAQHKVFIPIYGRAESLNVAAAAAVILYEAARQRRGCVAL